MRYSSSGTKYNLQCLGDLKVDHTIIDTNYNRYDSPYAKAKKKDKTITIEYNGKSLFLDFENMIRKFN